MRKMLLCIMAIFISHIITVNAIAHCPFSYTVYVIDGDHPYGGYWRWKKFLSTTGHSFPIVHGYPVMLKVLSINPMINKSSYNPHIKYETDTYPDWVCYFKSYGTVACHYFRIYQEESSCEDEKRYATENNIPYGHPTTFEVMVGTQASPPGEMDENRAGRNCIFTITAGQNDPLHLDPAFQIINCTCAKDSQTIDPVTNRPACKKVEDTNSFRYGTIISNIHLNGEGENRLKTKEDEEEKEEDGTSVSYPVFSTPAAKK